VFSVHKLVRVAGKRFSAIPRSLFFIDLVFLFFFFFLWFYENTYKANADNTLFQHYFVEKRETQQGPLESVKEL